MEHITSKIKRTYLFVIGILLLGISVQLIFYFFHIPKNHLTTLLVDFREVTVLGIPLLLFFLITKEKPRDVFLFHKISFRNIIYVVLLVLLFVPLSIAISTVTRIIFPNPILQSPARTYTSTAFWFMLIAIALQPALLEELAFRGIVHDGFSDYPLKKQALLVGLCFGFFHLNFNQFFYTVVLGFLVVFILYYTQSIIATMLFHFLYNGIATLASFLSRAHLASNAPTTTSTTQIASLTSALVLAVFAGALFWWIYQSFVKYNRKRLGMNPPVSVPVVPIYYPGAPAPIVGPPAPQPSTNFLEPTPKKQRLFTPLLIVTMAIAIGFATFVQIYDTLIIR
ncbi:MAG: CPBP family intramembrane metalloprotease [Coriobacteriia bacterium]|nr:CPBP family intramembrane metalloprotease [Coriobacteriia bacterium]